MTSIKVLLYSFIPSLPDNQNKKYDLFEDIGALYSSAGDRINDLGEKEGREQLGYKSIFCPKPLVYD